MGIISQLRTGGTTPAGILIIMSAARRCGNVRWFTLWCKNQTWDILEEWEEWLWSSLGVYHPSHYSNCGFFLKLVWLWRLWVKTRAPGWYPKIAGEWMIIPPLIWQSQTDNLTHPHMSRSPSFLVLRVVIDNKGSSILNQQLPPMTMKTIQVLWSSYINQSILDIH